VRRAVAAGNQTAIDPFRASGERVRVGMNERLESRVGKYRNQASTLRLLAYQTRYLVSRHRLLMLADSFDKLADRVEMRETALANAAD
jgi:hypothetical protein